MAGDGDKSTCLLTGGFGTPGRGLFYLISRRFFGRIQRKPGGGDRTSHIEKTLELYTDR